ncbi:hypothetical protein [Spirosoma fluviale]|nr:hypothetical protein [Spirosoma fluviale]
MLVHTASIRWLLESLAGPRQRMLTYEQARGQPRASTTNANDVFR